MENLVKNWSLFNNLTDPFESFSNGSNLTDGGSEFETSPGEERFEDEYSGEEYYEDSRYLLIKPLPHMILTCIIAAFGLIGNISVFILMRHSWFCNMSYSVYIKILAMSDSLVLIVVGGETVIDVLDHIDLTLGVNVHLCRVWYFCWGFATLLSPWLVVLLSFDRYFAVVFPFLRSHFCTPKIAMVSSAIVILLSLSEGTFWATQFDTFIDDEYEASVCFIREDTEVIRNYFTISTVVVKSTLPCFIILLLNIQIIVVLKRSALFRSSFSSSSTQSGKRSGGVDKATISLVMVAVLAFCSLTPRAIYEVNREW